VKDYSNSILSLALAKPMKAEAVTVSSPNLSLPQSGER
jgi:hypothetical protein